MTTVLILCRVANYDEWRPRYDGAVEPTIGIKSAQVWRGQADPDLVAIAEVFESRLRPLCLRQACRMRWPPMVWICNPCGWSFSTTRGTSNAERTRPKLPRGRRLDVRGSHVPSHSVSPSWVANAELPSPEGPLS